MFKFTFTAILLFLCFFGVSGQKTVETQIKTEAWKEFVSKEAGFKTSFPGTPTTSIEVVMATPIKTTNQRFEVSLNQGYLAVHFSDHPLLPNFDNEGLKADYDYLKNNVAKSADAEIIKESEIYLGQHLGREVIFRLKDEAVIDRFFLIDKRLYQIIVSISFSDWENKRMQEELKKFFDSFSLIENN